MLQLISFIDSSSGDGSRNIYYVSTFSTAVRASTGVFLSNTDRRVSRLVAQLFVYRPGSTNLAVGIDDLTAQFSDLALSIPAVAILVAAGSSSRTSAVSAANRLRSAYSGGVSVGTIALGSGASTATLSAIASSGLGGDRLTFPGGSSSSIAARCASVVRSLGASPMHMRTLTNSTSSSVCHEQLKTNLCSTGNSTGNSSAAGLAMSRFII